MAYQTTHKMPHLPIQGMQAKDLAIPREPISFTRRTVEVADGLLPDEVVERVLPGPSPTAIAVARVAAAMARQEDEGLAQAGEAA